MKLYLLGANEVIGLEEIMDSTVKKRKMTVKCSLNNSVVFFISKDNFLTCVNLFKFGDKLV
jgi:hypothetical protein